MEAAAMQKCKVQMRAWLPLDWINDHDSPADWTILSPRWKRWIQNYSCATVDRGPERTLHNFCWPGTQRPYFNLVKISIYFTKCQDASKSTHLTEYRIAQSNAFSFTGPASVNLKQDFTASANRNFYAANSNNHIQTGRVFFFFFRNLGQTSTAPLDQAEIYDLLQLDPTIPTPTFAIGYIWPQMSGQFYKWATQVPSQREGPTQHEQSEAK